MSGIEFIKGKNLLLGSSDSFTSNFASAFEEHCAHNGITNYGKTWSGRLTVPREEVVALVTTVFNPGYTSESYGKTNYEMYSDEGYITLRMSSLTDVDIYILTSNRDTIGKMHEKFSKWILTESDPGRVFMLTQGYGGGLQFESIGVGGKDIERGNYTDDVLAGYDHLMTEFGEKDPCGRLALVVGPTGTGKTHLIRGMLMSEKANFAFLPPQLVPQIGGPSIIKSIKDFHNTYKNRPLVLVLEDADECLLPRGVDNMSSITAILNATEGILGQLLDVRIVATTNAELKKIDTALARPGRLCCRMDVLDHTPDMANKIANRIIGGVTVDQFKKKTSLAEVYSFAKKLKGTSGHTECQTETKIGF